MGRSRLNCLTCARRELLALMAALKGRRIGSRRALAAIPRCFRPDHPVVHSETVDACVDAGILSVVEAVNAGICPTWSSCQDGGFLQRETLTVEAQHWPTMRDWLAEHSPETRVEVVDFDPLDVHPTLRMTQGEHAAHVVAFLFPEGGMAGGAVGGVVRLEFQSVSMRTVFTALFR